MEFKRNGAPLRGHIVARLVGSGKRVLANHADEHTLRFMASATAEIVGKKGWVKQEKGRGVFTFGESASL